MNSQSGTTSKSPPYVAYATFKNFLVSVGSSVVPKLINKHLMPGQSGSNQTQLLAALRFFDLMDEGGVPTEEFAALVKAPENERQAVWRRVFENAYAGVMEGLDLANANIGLLNQRFAEQGITGSTLRKCQSFFLTGAEDAGIPLAAGLKPTRGAKSGRPRRSRSRGDSGVGSEATAYTPPPQAPKSMQEMLLSKFPEFDPAWPDALKTAWFEGFGKLMNAAEGSSAEKGEGK